MCFLPRLKKWVSAHYFIYDVPDVAVWEEFPDKETWRDFEQESHYFSGGSVKNGFVE